MNILMWNLAQMSLTVLPTKKKISVSKIPGSLNLKFTFQFDHSSMCQVAKESVKWFSNGSEHGLSKR